MLLKELKIMKIESIGISSPIGNQWNWQWEVECLSNEIRSMKIVLTYSVATKGYMLPITPNLNLPIEYHQKVNKFYTF